MCDFNEVECDLFRLSSNGNRGDNVIQGRPRSRQGYLGLQQAIPTGRCHQDLTMAMGRDGGHGNTE